MQTQCRKLIEVVVGYLKPRKHHRLYQIKTNLNLCNEINDSNKYYFSSCEILAKYLTNFKYINQNGLTGIKYNKYVYY